MKFVPATAAKRLRTGALKLLFLLPLTAVLFSALRVIVMRQPWSPLFLMDITLALGVYLTSFIALSSRRDLVLLFRASFWATPTIVGIGTGPLWFVFALRIGDIDPNFFEISAQVIPVLLLAITIDNQRSRSLESIDFMLSVLGLIGAEIVALYGIAGGDVGSIGYVTVCIGLTIGFAALVMALILDYEPTRRNPSQKRSHTLQNHAVDDRDEQSAISDKPHHN